MERRILLGGAAALLSACAAPVKPTAAPQQTIYLPLADAWMDGNLVKYITTDASDQGLARKMRVNFVPRLRLALPPSAGADRHARSALEKVYMFAGEEQINVFQSAPSPLGPDNLDQSYSPLWRGVLVRWLLPRHQRELRSEEALLQARDAGWISTMDTDMVINCPIVQVAQNRIPVPHSG